MADVCVVFCMDTEGPCFDPGNDELLSTWEAVDAAMDKLFDPDFRSRLRDPSGGDLRIGWFFLTWSGFSSNPRRRAFGYHAVRDHYLERWGEQLAAFGDEQCWHYHQPSASGVGNEWGLDWSASSEYASILSRQLLEREWFPSCYRAGGTIMDATSSRWVDRWFPLDFSNRAPLAVDGVVDWSGGVADWTLYHPDPENFRHPGSGRRRMARCLDLVTGVHTLTRADVQAAFERAQAGEPAILSCFDHDYRDIADRVDAYRALVYEVAAEYPDVGWRYAAPTEAARRFLGAPPQQRLELEADVAGGRVYIWSTAPIFQPFPWIAVRRPDGDVEHVEQDVLRLDDRHWQWTPDGEWTEAAVGASTDLGVAAVTRVAASDGPGAGFLSRATDVHPSRPHSIWEHTKRYTRSVVGRAAGDEEELDSAAQARELLAARLEPGSSVLDVGCGGGHLWRSLQPLGLEYHGIDPYERAIELGRLLLSESGVPRDRLRALDVVQLPPDERYDAVVSLSMLLYEPDFRLPLEVMAKAATKLLVVRSSFGQTTEVRYLEDVLLEPGFETMRAYFSIFSRADVESFLRREGFRVEWIEDRRQRDRFGGEAEVVGGIPLPYEFLVAERS